MKAFAAKNKDFFGSTEVHLIKVMVDWMKQKSNLSILSEEQQLLELGCSYTLKIRDSKTDMNKIVNISCQMDECLVYYDNNSDNFKVTDVGVFAPGTIYNI